MAKRHHPGSGAYIGTYSKADKDHIEKISDRFKCKVHIYNAKTATVWG